jgi:hypothetical protein
MWTEASWYPGEGVLFSGLRRFMLVRCGMNFVVWKKGSLNKCRHARHQFLQACNSLLCFSGICIMRSTIIVNCV